ncbi:MAG: response regulator [Planctomycetes bacterium]|nr:response regulator [Planctomycetota bacterium]
MTEGRQGDDAMNRRILVIDDNPAIHADFRKILTPTPIASDDLLATEAELFGTPQTADERVRFDLVTASQGQEGCELVKTAAAEGRPFAMAFVDMRMPPGWDGLETIQRIWAAVPEIEIVICTAFSDYSWEETVRRLGRTDRLLIVKKPFDHAEVLQVASALTHKWNLQQQARRTLSGLSDLVRQRTADLERARDELVGLNQSLVRARDAAESANRSKTIFLANVSHELRTPMTAILGYTEELQVHMGHLAQSSPEQHALETIRRNAQHLVVIIGDLLDMAKIEAGKLTAETVTTDARRTVEEVLTLLQAKAAQKGLTLTCEFATPVPTSVATDPLRLRQILVNLVDNAIKFTSVGGVRLVVRFVAGPPPLLAIEVHDSGAGIAPEALGRMFRPFEQADASTTRQFGGTGLGLAISHHLARLLGGDITVTSEPGRGSCFRLTVATGPIDGVPFAREPGREMPAAALPAVTPTRRLDGTRVLVVEDGADNQMLLDRVLRRAGCDVEIAADGVQCLERAADEGRPLDLILMDIQMPTMDGITATSMLRQRGCRLPIVALTANAMAADQQACIAAGCDAVLTKPIDRARLFETLARFARTPGSEG